MSKKKTYHVEIVSDDVQALHAIRSIVKTSPFLSHEALPDQGLGSPNAHVKTGVLSSNLTISVVTQSDLHDFTDRVEGLIKYAGVDVETLTTTYNTPEMRTAEQNDPKARIARQDKMYGRNAPKEPANKIMVVESWLRNVDEKYFQEFSDSKPYGAKIKVQHAGEYMIETSDLLPQGTVMTISHITETGTSDHPDRFALTLKTDDGKKVEAHTTSILGHAGKETFRTLQRQIPTELSL